MTTLRFEDVHKSFGAQRVLDGVTLDIPLDRFTYVVGRSGGGKSVLCRLAVALTRSDRGEILFDGQPVSKLGRDARIALRRRYPYVVQGAALLDWLTLAENVGLTDRAASPETLRAALAKVGLADRAQTYPPQNSPGVNKRAALARALLMQPRFLLLDEPTTGLDAQAADEVNATLQALRREGLGALVVSHDYEALERFADAVVVLANGRVAFHGTPRDFFASSQPAVRALTAPAEV